MVDPWTFIAIGGLSLVIFILSAWLKGKGRSDSRRDFLEKSQLNEAEWEIIGRRCRIFKALPVALKEEMAGIIRVLISEKNFEACGGLARITEEMKLVVMAQASLLLVGRKHRYYPLLKSVLLYPEPYQVRDKDGVEQTRLGESWSSGSVILAWKSVVKGGEDAGDGRNVVIHEFAHQLDQENDDSMGAPVLEDVMAYRDWARVFGEAYGKFVERVDTGRKTVLDCYGATNPAEFFAVGSETFFEKPKQLKERYPELYEQFQQYYGLDPSTW